RRGRAVTLDGKESCCGENSAEARILAADWRYNLRDRLSELLVRCGFGRMSYRVEPGLYALGRPDEESPVMVTANYKMSFDRLRRNLAGRSAWILVLDTKGVNVWCAAGKGTFGTEELVRRAASTGLSGRVTHRRLIVPQLGATGVSAYRVKESSGWKVVFGPVRAEDLPEFIDAGMKATPAMRRIGFSLADRLVLVPVDVKAHLKYLLLAAAVFFALSGLVRGGYSIDAMLVHGTASAVLLAAALVSGGVLTPVLLPWLLPRPFAVKGAVVWAAVLAGITLTTDMVTGAGHSPAETAGMLGILAWLMIGGAASSYLAMNFTGATTFTSLSGVRLEMKYALPAQVISAAAGTVLWIVLRYFQ
ncbi:MAG TPA: mercury methylation corrinoid protein HgcA, partial [Candidatus Krumholzibacterium sp.]|nr:mercury methylation corrinoid protein HgcA [Candidatus Krumholzibacterium sp.]